METLTPTLYIILRNDLASLSPGKAATQASHATNDFEMKTKGLSTVAAWREDRTFGRCITLGGNAEVFRELKEEGKDTTIPWGVITDPTYPVTDGDITHLVSIETAAWFFLSDTGKKCYDYLCDEYQKEWDALNTLSDVYGYDRNSINLQQLRKNRQFLEVSMPLKLY